MADFSILFTFGPSGGSGGESFSDMDILSKFVARNVYYRISKIKIRHGLWIDAIQTCWVTSLGAEVWSPRLGGNGGTEITIDMDPNHPFSGIKGTYDQYVNQLNLQISQEIAEFGNSIGKKEYSYNYYNGRFQEDASIGNYEVVGFWGRAGSFVNAIGPIFRLVET
jgi:hypothetical protein